MIVLLTTPCLIYGQVVQEGKDEAYRSTRHFSSNYAIAERRFSFENKGTAGWQQWQSDARAALTALLGLDQMKRQMAGFRPSGKLLRQENADGFVRQFWVVNTEPTVPLPLIVLLPSGKKGPLPLVLTPHGHGRSTQAYAGVFADSAEQASIRAGERDVAVQAVKEGYIAIAPATRAFGETRTEEDIKEDKPFSCRIQLMHDLLLGRTPVGDRVWDMQRILDWAIANFDIDTSRVAITGNSAGGTVTLFTAAVDTRFTIAAPASYFSTFEGSIGSITHCDCNYIPGILNWGRMSDVAGLIAPRPISVIHGKKDEIYPIAETRKAFDQLRKIYEAAGAGSHLQLYEGAEGHRYYQAGAWPFIRHYFSSTDK
ncbi:MAG: alpha/beta hydrolase family protein [Chitinophagaceae bacterium]